MKIRLIAGACCTVLAGGALAAMPTEESGDTNIPLNIVGEIVEVVACEFAGGAAAGLEFDFTAANPAAENQYETEGSAELSIDCSNGSDGNQYQVAFDTSDDATADYDNRSSDIAVDVGGDPLTAIISASDDGGTTFQPVDQDFAPVESGNTNTYTFLAAIQDPNGATGSVTAPNTPTLHVQFDGESGGVDDDAPADGPLLGIGPLGGADAPVVDAANGVLNTIGDNDPTPVTGTLYPEITALNTAVNDALGGAGDLPPPPDGGIPIAPLDGTPAEQAPEEEVLGQFDTSEDGELSPDDVPDGS